MAAVAFWIVACDRPEVPTVAAPSEPSSVVGTTFDDDLGFLQQHTEILVLRGGEARVAVAPEYQGRVMTSTATGGAGESFGWINRAAIAAGERQPHINVFGGEDRFWLGPEGGQYSLFFAADAPFDLEHWQTPEPIDWGAWQVVERSELEARLRRSMELVNYSGTTLSLEAERTVRLLSAARAAEHLGMEIDAGLSFVGFESENRIRNRGAMPWRKESGLVSIWILGMFNPSSTTTVVLPVREGSEEELGRPVNDAYFGPVPPDRLRLEPDAIYFRGDGEYRSKIGVSRRRARPILGSYDATRQLLTLVSYSLPEDATDYVNSMWELQERPYDGDVVNSYNDGPPEPGVPPLGPFYELETSSPAAELAPGEELVHLHRTFHFTGPPELMDGLTRATLGVSLDRLQAVFR